MLLCGNITIMFLIIIQAAACKRDLEFPDSVCLSCKSNQSKEVFTVFKKEPLDLCSTDHR